MQDKPELIQGGFFEDERGRLDFVNGFNLDEIKRFYFSTNNGTEYFRAWQGHKIESRWFFCVKGRFEVKLVKVDDWENPSESLTPLTFELSSENPQILFIPPGYVNGFKALDESSKLMILSNFELGVNKNDEVRFDSNTWRKN